MNKERIQALADLIEKQPHTDIADATGFNMDDYRHQCGTPACIAGWATAMADDNPAGDEPIHGSPHYRATKFLDIGSEVGFHLFQPQTMSAYQWHLITPAQAAATLRHFANTGVVDWEVGARKAGA
jgi:hypothetical protein